LLGATGWMIEVSSPGSEFSLHIHVQTGSAAHPASYPGGMQGYYPGGKTAWVWSWPLTSI